MKAKPKPKAKPRKVLHKPAPKPAPAPAKPAPKAHTPQPTPPLPPTPPPKYIPEPLPPVPETVLVPPHMEHKPHHKGPQWRAYETSHVYVAKPGGPTIVLQLGSGEPELHLYAGTWEQVRGIAEKLNHA